MKKLSAILFDIDDTLYSTTEFVAEARDQSVKAMLRAGLRMSHEDCRRELEEVIAEFGSNDEHHFERLLQRVSRNYYPNVNPAIIVGSGITAYHETKHRGLAPYEDAWEALKFLSTKELLLGVVSTGITVKQAEKLIRLKVLPYLDSRAIFFTDQMGMAKENPRLFRRICDELVLKPEETMYVGDNPVRDVDPPNAIGMITVLNRRSGKYQAAQGKTEPVHVVHNFWDLLDILKTEYGIV